MTRRTFASSSMRLDLVCRRPAVSAIRMSARRAIAASRASNTTAAGSAFGRVGDDLGVGALGPDPELVDRRGAERVGRREDDAPAVRALARGELADGRGLAGAVDADDEHDRGRRPRRPGGAPSGSASRGASRAASSAADRLPRPPGHVRLRARSTRSIESAAPTSPVISVSSISSQSAVDRRRRTRCAAGPRTRRGTSPGRPRAPRARARGGPRRPSRGCSRRPRRTGPRARARRAGAADRARPGATIGRGLDDAVAAEQRAGPLGEVPFELARLRDGLGRAISAPLLADQVAARAARPGRATRPCPAASRAAGSSSGGGSSGCLRLVGSWGCSGSADEPRRKKRNGGPPGQPAPPARTARASVRRVSAMACASSRRRLITRLTESSPTVTP